MAEAVLERTSKKLEKSLGRGKNVKERAKAWDEINKVAVTELVAGEEKKDDKEAGWETDEDMGGDAEGATAEAPAIVPEPAQVPLPTMDEDEEIL